jgi:hypothetical protein
MTTNFAHSTSLCESVQVEDLEQRMRFCRGQIVEALGDIANGNPVEAARALRYAIAELDGKARASINNERGEL